MENFNVITKEIKPPNYGGLADLVLKKINDPKLKDEFNNMEQQWLRDHAPKLPLILKNEKLCGILNKISSEESITRYEIAKKLNLDKTQVLREVKKLEDLGLVYINGRIGNFGGGKPCYINRELSNVINFIKALINVYHGLSFNKD